MWDCRGEEEGCCLQCVKTVDTWSFIGVSNLKMLKWIVAHRLIHVDCQTKNCRGEGYPVGLEEEVGLKCSSCGEVSKGGKRGFLAKRKMGFVKSMLVVFCISVGFCSSMLP